MANMRNKWEFYGSILEALGVEYTEAELKNNETLRAKLLEGLGVEYTYDDVNQYPLWREKLVEGVGNMSEGGGGSSDFSTLAVTVDNESNEDINLNFIPVPIVEHIIQDVGKSAVMLLPNGLMASSDASPGANANSTEVYKFLLAKDSNFTLISNWGAEVPNNITVSGNAEKSYFIDQGQNCGGIIIAGDCTITIS